MKAFVRLLVSRGLSPDGSRWIACKPGFFLPVRVLSRLFRRLFLDGLAALHTAGRLAFRGDLAPLADQRAFDAALARLRRAEWVVFAKRPFAGPQAVLAYLARYTHRVAISNSRLVALDEAGVTFKWKDYRIKGRDRIRTMTLDAAEFIRRFQAAGSLPLGDGDSHLESFLGLRGVCGVVLEQHFAARATIPVVTLATDVRDCGRHAYVGPDDRRAGRVAGDLMGRFLGPTGGDIVMIAGLLSLIGNEEREMGFRSVLRERYPTCRRRS